MFPKPTGAATFCASGAFQLDNSVKGLVNCWQTPDTLIGAIHAPNSCWPVLASSGLLRQDLRCFMWCLPFRRTMLHIVCNQQLLKLLPLSHSKRLVVPTKQGLFPLHQLKNVSHGCFNCLVGCDVPQIQGTQSRDQQTSHTTLQVARPTKLRNRGNLACSNLGCYVLGFEGAWCMKPSSTAT